MEGWAVTVTVGSKESVPDTEIPGLEADPEVVVDSAVTVPLEG